MMIDATQNTTGTDDQIGSSFKHPSMQWIAEHPGGLAEYEGNWVVLNGDQVIAHAPGYAEAARLARESGADNPLLVGVPRTPWIM